MARISRRTFLKTSAAASAATLALRAASSKADPAAQVAVTPRISQFEYADIKLLEGPMLEQFNANHALYMSLDDDSLLKPFRKRAGLPAPGEDMGGWYNESADYDPPKNMTGYIPGHSFGQYMSGLARAYAITGSKPTQDKVQRLVRGFAPTLTEKFYVDYPLPAYTFDKTNCGLIDAHQFAGDPTALAVLNHATDAVLPHLPEKALTREEMCALPHKNISYCWDESYTLPENLYLAYRRGAGPRFRELATRFLQDDTYFNPLAAGDNVLPGLHAYSHVNALCSASQAYLVLGSEKHLRAARNGFDFVRSTQSFATGGWGPDETFRKPGSGDMGASLTKTHSSFETPCGSYGHFKIARYLMTISGDSRYGDSMERVLYNTILGAKPTKQDGYTFYYSDYNNSASKFYHQDKWPCCSGTFPQIAADYGISSYFRGPDGVYVNLYVPSELHWRQNGASCKLTQQTQYPYTAETSLALETSRPEAFTVYLRVPAWAGPKSAVAVNGKAFPVDLKPGSFVALRRTWKTGDRVEFTLDMPSQLEAIDPQHANTVALLHGPLALFAIGEGPGPVTRAQLLSATQIATGSTEWNVSTDKGKMILKSFPAIHDEKYRLYHDATI